MNNEDTVSVLNELIETSVNGKKGFADAAEQATLPNLKTMFAGRAADCASAAGELQALVGSLGGTPAQGGTMVGAAVRGWDKMMASFGDTDLSLLEAAESAEDSAKRTYATALAGDLSESVRGVVQRQSDGAVRNHDLIRTLRNDYRDKTSHTSS